MCSPRNHTVNLSPFCSLPRCLGIDALLTAISAAICLRSFVTLPHIHPTQSASLDADISFPAQGSRRRASCWLNECPPPRSPQRTTAHAHQLTTTPAKIPQYKLITTTSPVLAQSLVPAPSHGLPIQVTDRHNPRSQERVPSLSHFLLTLTRRTDQWSRRLLLHLLHCLLAFPVYPSKQEPAVSPRAPTVLLG